jgi:ABC-type multidrug transport system fused ATPase/permease subunit
MNLPLTQYRNLFGVYLRPQRARVALLAMLLLAVTALQLWSPQLLRQFIDAAAAAETPLRMLLTLAALFLLTVLATQAVQMGATHLSEQVGWATTNHLSSTSITSVCYRRLGRCVSCSARSPAVRGETRKAPCALFTH